MHRIAEVVEVVVFREVHTLASESSPPQRCSTIRSLKKYKRGIGKLKKKLSGTEIATQTYASCEKLLLGFQTQGIPGDARIFTVRMKTLLGKIILERYDAKDEILLTLDEIQLQMQAFESLLERIEAGLAPKFGPVTTGKVAAASIKVESSVSS